MTRYVIHYKIGSSMRQDVIEAESLDQAEQKANERHPSWVDIYKQKINEPDLLLVEVN